MTFAPPPRHRVPDLVLTPYSDLSIGGSLAVTAAPSSGTITAQVRAVLYPLYLLEPFTVSKAFWCNGATVGTDSIDLGIYRMTDQSTGRCDLIRSTGAVLSAGTVSVVQEVSAWKVARLNLTSGGDSTDQDTYTTASVTLKAGRLYLLSVENSHASSAPAVSSVDSATGGYPTFASRATTQYNGTLNRISLWSAVPTTDFTGTLRIKFAASSGVTGATWSLDEQSGVDTSTNDGIVQTATGTGNSTTPLATLSAFGSANNAAFGAHGKAANATSTPGSGFTELSDTGTATPAQSISTEWRVDNDTTVDFTITSAQWGCIAAEIKADASPFVIPPSTPGSSDIYMAFAISGGTATVLRSGPTTGISDSTGLLITSPVPFPLPSNLTPIAVASIAAVIVLCGFSSRSLIG